MASTENSDSGQVVYEGETLIGELDFEDPEAMERLEERLESFIELEEDEFLQVKNAGDGRMEVRKLTEHRLD